MSDAVSRILSRFSSVYGRELSPELIAEWEIVLGEYPPALLTEACDELMGESTFFPKPAEILAIVRRLQAEAAKAQAEPDEHWKRDTYTCHICRDTGYVSVWHPFALQSALCLVRGQISRQSLKLYECAAKCSCQRGQDRPGKAQTLSNESVIIDRTASFQDQIESLLAWAKSRAFGQRVDEFDIWNRD